MHPSGNWLHDPTAFELEPALDGDQRIAIHNVQSAFRALQIHLDAVLPEWLPEREIVAQRLLEAAMWAIRGICRAGPSECSHGPATAKEGHSHDATCLHDCM